MKTVPVLIPEGNPSEVTGQQLCQTASSLFIPYAMHVGIQLFEISPQSFCFYKGCVKACLSCRLPRHICSIPCSLTPLQVMVTIPWLFSFKVILTTLGSLFTHLVGNWIVLAAQRVWLWHQQCSLVLTPWKCLIPFELFRSPAGFIRAPPGHLPFPSLLELCSNSRWTPG